MQGKLASIDHVNRHLRDQRKRLFLKGSSLLPDLNGERMTSPPQKEGIPGVRSPAFIRPLSAEGKDNFVRKEKKPKLPTM